ncbi:MAG TPA: TMEM175 family protein [Acidimicrobiales bacterium]|nr:TMEM175 family protein [Acidimicrobiales bacterium]
MTDDSLAGAIESGPEPDVAEVIDTHRLESFSDGVLAVIITLTAFELRPPTGESWGAITHRVPALLVYVLSFAIIATYWNYHHHVFRVTQRIDASVIWANANMLFWLSLLPLATEWVGNAYHSVAPAVAYGVVALGAALAVQAMVWVVARLNYDDARTIQAVIYDAKGVLYTAISYVVAIGLAFISPYLAYGCYVIVLLMWIISSLRPVRR